MGGGGNAVEGPQEGDTFRGVGKGVVRCSGVLLLVWEKVFVKGGIAESSSSRCGGPLAFSCASACAIEEGKAFCSADRDGDPRRRRGPLSLLHRIDFGCSSSSTTFLEGPRISAVRSAVSAVTLDTSASSRISYTWHSFFGVELLEEASITGERGVGLELLTEVNTFPIPHARAVHDAEKMLERFFDPVLAAVVAAAADRRSLSRAEGGGDTLEMPCVQYRLSLSS